MVDYLNRRIVTMAIALLTASTAVTGLSGPAAVQGFVGSQASEPSEERHLTLAELAEIYGDAAKPLTAPRDMDYFETRDFLLNENQVLGRSPNAWVDWAHATYNFETLPTKAPSTTDLVSSVVRLNGLLGLELTASEIIDMQQQAAALHPIVRVAFANLVATVVDAYAAQIPLADDLVARFPTEFDPMTPFVTEAQREEMAARAADIVAALNLFRITTSGLETAAACPSPPLFTDPEGAIVLGSDCDDTWTRAGLLQDPVLLVDIGGDDTYLNSAGGADPAGLLAPGQGNELVLSVVADALGNDDYTYDGLPSTVQGAGAIGAIGILVDANGDDSYYAKMTRTNTISALTGVQYYFDGGGQGYGFGGIGIQLDGTGNDVFNFEIASTQGRHIWAFAQGFGAAGGLGLSSDAFGTDKWLSDGLGITGGTLGFQGIYTQGTGFYGGVGIMTDTGRGNDLYVSYDNSTTTDYYAQGFGAFGGLGVLFEDGGNDNYEAVSLAGAAWINPLLHCAFGTASLFGVGVMIDAGGHDRYYGKADANGQAHVMNEGFGGIGAGVGVFVDVSGDDWHEMVGDIKSGRGRIDTGAIFDNLQLGEGANIVGFYLDSGGIDQYPDNGPGADSSTWVIGADVNLVPNL